MASASGGSKAASASVGPWTNGGTSESITHLSFWTASTAGTFNASASVTSQAWVSTNTYTLTALTISVSPIAA
jgi:hypothetical protein